MCLLCTTALNHNLRRTSGGSSFKGQIQEALTKQSVRMKAAQEEWARREASKKRPPSAAAIDGPDSKRLKLEDGASATILAGFDFSTLPTTLVTELIVANIQSFSEAELTALVQAYRQRGTEPAEAPAHSAAGPSVPTGPANGAAVHASEHAPTPEEVPSKPGTPSPEDGRAERSKSPSTPPGVKEEPVDPLQMNIDDEELEYEPEKLNQEVRGHPDAPSRSLTTMGCSSRAVQKMPRWRSSSQTKKWTYPWTCGNSNFHHHRISPRRCGMRWCARH